MDKTLLSIILVLSLASFARGNDRTDSLIQLLNKELDRKDIYIEQKLERIHKLRLEAENAPINNLKKQFDLYNKLYHEYKFFQYDSAFAYGRKLLLTAYRLKDRSLVDYARTKLAFIFISSGMFKETLDSTSVINAKNLPDSSKISFYWVMSRTYSDLNSYNKRSFYQKQYAALCTQYIDSALALTNPASSYYFYLVGAKHLREGRYQQALETITQLLKMKLTLHEIAGDYCDLSMASYVLNDHEKAIQYGALSSIADIRSATRETVAMYTLAKLLYEKGDTKNAYRFIKQALDDAEFYGALQRKVEISSILPVIAATELNEAEWRRKIWSQYGIAISIFSLMAIAFAFIIFKQLRKIQQADIHINNINHKLVEANKIKEEYLGYYFTVTSDYLTKIEDFKKSIHNKLQTKKYDEIRFVLNNIHHQKEREDLYRSFDKVFIKLFPDFINNFNSFFKPEDRFILADNQILNTELRIFALIRMGIHDSEKIARILDYSLNTIYTYKTRVKSKSIIPNEEFEKRVMEIKSA
jgi:tetratricopeptide (TPR) repeat protein